MHEERGYCMKKAATETAHKNTAKISIFLCIAVKNSEKNLTLADVYDPELDGSLIPPTPKRKTRKSPYKKSEAVKRLEAVTGDKHRDDTANGLTKCIIAYIKYRGGQAERINTTGVPLDKRRMVTDVLGHRRQIGSVQWRRSGSTVGSADISATIRGRSVKIEVKVGRDRQSDAQRRYQAAVEQAGGLYYIAHDFTSFVDWYQTNFGEGGEGC